MSVRLGAFGMLLSSSPLYFACALQRADVAAVANLYVETCSTGTTLTTTAQISDFTPMSSVCVVWNMSTQTIFWAPRFLSWCLKPSLECSRSPFRWLNFSDFEEPKTFPSRLKRSCGIADIETLLARLWRQCITVLYGNALRPRRLISGPQKPIKSGKSM